MLAAYNIPNQLPDEQVVKIIRKDFFIMFKRILAFLFLLSILIGFGTYAYASNPEVVYDVYFPVMILAASVYLLFIWLFFFFTFIDYYLDIWIITNERIINIEQKGFFSRTISDSRLFRIQDVTSEVKGVFPTIFDYGDIFIQTAGEKNRFNFSQVPDPNSIRDIIIRLAEIDRARQTTETKQDLVGVL